MGNAACIHSKIVIIREKSPFLPFLSTLWGSVLNWTDSDLAIFAQCLSPVKIKANEEVRGEIKISFSEGEVEIHAIVQDEVSAKNGVRVEYKILEEEGRIARRRLQRS